MGTLTEPPNCSPTAVRPTQFAYVEAITQFALLLGRRAPSKSFPELRRRNCEIQALRFGYREARYADQVAAIIKQTTT